jgi:formate dehydrogenase iron-sulfur subunit
MVPSRRDFFKILGAGTGAMLLSGALSTSKAGAASSTLLTQSTGKAMLYDALKCVGCRACQNACKEWNNTPSESIGYGNIYDNPNSLSARHWTIIKAREYTHNGSPALLLCRYQCMHCTEASCESVCPTGAISHQGSAVVIDQQWCIGCGYCVQSCPFGVPHKEHGINAGSAKKCTFCVDRQADGLAPACVEACPAGALQFGERDELIAQAKVRVEDLRRDGYTNATFYGETELGGLHALYILAESPSIYGLPETPLVATSKTAFQWLSGIAVAGVLAVIPFWLLFKRKSKTNAPVTQDNDESGRER